MKGKRKNDINVEGSINVGGSREMKKQVNEKGWKGSREMKM